MKTFYEYVNGRPRTYGDARMREILADMGKERLKTQLKYFCIVMIPVTATLIAVAIWC